jgi:hypothetical protein
MVNLKSRFKPLIIVKPGSRMATFNGEVRKEFSHFPWWSHWPVARISSDGRYAMAADQAAHSSLSWVSQPAGAFLYGMSDQALEKQVPLAKSWIHPAPVKVSGNAFVSDGYSQDQRAYLLHRTQAGDALETVLEGSAESPICNAALVIRGWGEKAAKLTLDGVEVPRGATFRYGHRRTLEGTDLIVWIKAAAERSMSILLVGTN